MEQTYCGLQAGFAKVNITPDYSVGMSGFGNVRERRSRAVAEPIYATCIALREADNTVLLFTLDYLGISRDMWHDIRKAVLDATGIENAFFAATHSHTAPAWDDDEAGLRFQKDLLAALADAARQALADLAPAKAETVTTHVPNMAFVRHYLTADGTYAGSNFGSFENNPPVAHAAKADDSLVVVKFAREGKQNILLVNWAAHADRSSQIGYYNLAPSFPGPLRDRLEELTGDRVAYFTAASGNVNSGTQIPGEMENYGWREYGQALAQSAFEALPGLRPVEGSELRVTKKTTQVGVNHSWDHTLEQAKEVYDLWQAEGKAAGDALGKTYDFTSVYQASVIIARCTMGPDYPMEQGAFRIGNLGFIVGSYEMFTESGQDIRKRSPYETTFLVTGNHLYIPTEAAFDYRCYEADTCFFAKGTAELLVDNFVQMLEEIQS